MCKSITINRLLNSVRRQHKEMNIKVPCSELEDEKLAFFVDEGSFEQWMRGRETAEARGQKISLREHQRLMHSHFVSCASLVCVLWAKLAVVNCERKIAEKQDKKKENLCCWLRIDDDADDDEFISRLGREEKLFCQSQQNMNKKVSFTSRENETEIKGFFSLLASGCVQCSSCYLSFRFSNTAGTASRVCVYVVAVPTIWFH